MLVVPKSFSYAKIIYPSEARNRYPSPAEEERTTLSCLIAEHEVVDEELICDKDTSSVSRQAAATFPHWGRQFSSDCHICGGRATTASGGFFDEPIGSACEMP